MKTKFSGILTLLLAFVVQLSFAQEKTITGTVSDETGPLPGVSIIVKGTTNGTETDFDGKYSIKAKQGDVLRFSFVGMKTKEVPVGTSSSINVSLEGDNVLEEVVVTALGSKRNKRSLGYSQQTVDASELITSKQADIANSMAGKIAGIQIMAAPKSGFNQSQIRLRGNRNVLYVVDGIRLQSSDDVNPEDVKSMSVLKGTSATALYGPEGSNGVVIIVTNKAKSGDSSVTYDGSIEIGKAAYIAELQNEYGGGYSQTFPTFSYDATRDPSSWAAFDGQPIVQYFADESWGPKLDGRPVRQWTSWVPSHPNFGKLTPWVSNGGVQDFFKTSISSKHSLTFLKGGENFNLKLNVLKNDRTLNIENSKRANHRVSLSTDFNVNSKLNIFTNVSYQDRGTLNNPTEGYGSLGANIFQWWQAQLDLNEIRNYRQGGEIVSWNIKGPRDATPKYWDSPYFELYENLKHADRKSLIGNIGFNYEVNKFIKARVSYNKTLEKRGFDRRSAWGGLDTPSFSETDWVKNRNLFTGLLSFNKDFNDFNVNLKTGVEYDQYTLESTSASSKNGLTVPNFYSIATSKEKPDYTSNYLETKGRAAYISATLGYKNMLFFDGNLRKDWKSTAKIGDNSVLTKGATLSFVFTELLPESDILSFGKLRGGFAQGPRFPDAYALSETYSILPSFGNSPVSGLSGTIFNPNLKGGIQEEIELGAELRFLNSRLAFDFTYFNKTNKDLPTALELDPTTGYSSVLVNSGEQTFKGIELGISGTPIKNDNFTWTTSVNFATLRRDVVKLAEGLTQSDTRFLGSRWGGLVLRDEVGKRWGEVYGRRVKTINGKKVISSQANYVTEDNKSLGNYLPDVTGGFINSFRYKNFTLNVDMDYQIGGKYFSITQMFINSSGLGIETVGNNKLGNPVRNSVKNSAGSTVSYVKASDAAPDSGGHYIEGVDDNGSPVSYYVNNRRFWGNQFGNISEFTYDASYLSVRNIRLNYSFPKKITSQIGFSSLDVAGYVNNAFLLFSALPNVDPSQLEQRYRGINFMEGGQLPGVRTYGLNLRMTF